MRIEMHNLDGCGARRCHVYDLPPGPPVSGGGQEAHPTAHEYWPAVTDVPCPCPGCTGTIRWAEEGYVPGYRICDGCRRHFVAKGTALAPTLVRCGVRRSSL